jgi:FolB domain-containing protein
LGFKKSKTDIMTSTINLKNLKFEIFLGGETESKYSQTVELNIKIDINLNDVFESDNLEDTIDWQILYANLQNFFSSERYNLVETFTKKSLDLIFDFVSESCSVNQIEIELAKLNAIANQKGFPSFTLKQKYDGKTHYKNHYKNSGDFNNSFQEFKQKILESDSELLKLVSENLSSFVKQKNEISILDVGCGDGSISTLLYEEFNKHSKVSNYYGIDISATLINKFHEVLDDPNLFTLDVGGASNLETLQISNFDLILAFNSWYGLTFDLVEKYLFKMKKDSKLVVVLNAPNNIFSVLTKITGESIMDSTKFQKYLEVKNIQFEKYDFVSTKIGKDLYFDQNGITDIAKQVIDYNTRMRKSGDLENILQYFESECFQNPNTIFVIGKM